MKSPMLLKLAVLIGLIAGTIAAKAQGINGLVEVQLHCQIQQTSGITNLEINTQSLLELIAADQGFTLPSHAKLYLAGSYFAVLKADNTVATGVDTNILRVADLATVEKSSTSQNAKTYESNVNAVSVVNLNYNGSTLSFSCNFEGTNTINSLANFTSDKAVYSTSYSGSGLGTGTCGGQTMVVNGMLSSGILSRYPVGGSGSFPPANGSANPAGPW